MNWLRISIVAAAAVTCGCGTTPVYDYMRRPRILVDAPIPAFKIKQLEAHESPTYPGTIFVQAVNMLGVLASGDRIRWAAMRPELEPVYRQAALDALARTRNGCSLSDASVYPEAIAFVFNFTCAT